MSSASGQDATARSVATDNTRHDLEHGKRTDIADGEEISPENPQSKDLDFVYWDEPADPANPLNWKPGTKLTHVLLISAFTLYA